MGLGPKSGCVSSLEVPPFAPPKFANDDEEYTVQQYDKYTCISDKFHHRPGCINNLFKALWQVLCFTDIKVLCFSFFQMHQHSS